jgi:hypothetical protein
MHNGSCGKVPQGHQHIVGGMYFQYAVYHFGICILGITGRIRPYLPSGIKEHKVNNKTAAFNIPARQVIH